MLVTYQYTETITAYLNTVRDISHTMYQAALPWKLQAKRPSSLHVERRVKKNQQKKKPGIKREERTTSCNVVTAQRKSRNPKVQRY